MRETVRNKPTTLYLFTNTVNGKRYVGITCQGTAFRRRAHLWAAHNMPHKGSAFHKALVKYGLSIFRMDELAVYPGYAEAAQAEKKYIADYKPEYNCTTGGDGAPGYKFSAVAKRRMSQMRTGKPSHMKGKRHTDAAKEKMSASLKGKPAFWKGKKVPKHVVDAVRAGHAKWACDKDAVRRVINAACAAVVRPVVCLNDGLMFGSVTAASEHYGVDGSSISEVCGKDGARKMAGGLVFRYADEPHGGKAEADLVEQDVLQSRRRTAAIARASKTNRAVRCINDGASFTDAASAAAHYGINPDRVYASCRSRLKGARAYPKVRCFEYVEAA